MSGAAFVAGSLLFHVALYMSLGLDERGAVVEFEVPRDIELGVLDRDPGAQGAPASTPPAAAHATPEKPQPTEPAPQKHRVADQGGYRVVDAGTPEPAPDLVAASDTATNEGDGTPPGGYGARLGFGSGGFGSGSGGPPGAVIALHADLDQIRDTSLILETNALLAIIPEWERLLQGSGLDALHDFSRVFVATPNLKRSGLVVSGRAKGGAAAIRGAAERLAQERGLHAQFHSQGGLSVAAWRNHGPTARSVALLGSDQFVIARPDDVGRALEVSAALALRHERQRGMEKAAGTAALLAMYEGEAAALSVEGVRAFVPNDADYAPAGVRMSLRPIDEFTAKLRVYGYYESPARAQSALPRIESLRDRFTDHPRVKYLGLRSAIGEADIQRSDDTIAISTTLTMHQIRYLMAFVSAALKSRGE